MVATSQTDVRAAAAGKKSIPLTLARAVTHKAVDLWLNAMDRLETRWWHNGTTRRIESQVGSIIEGALGPKFGPSWRRGYDTALTNVGGLERRLEIRDLYRQMAHKVIDTDFSDPKSVEALRLDWQSTAMVITPSVIIPAEGIKFKGVN